ncbi:MAG: FecR domain-containing protein, partial [Planctomycetota bacterium]|nr:FecR domain-containing protein [Planctomycetota bacterium]
MDDPNEALGEAQERYLFEGGHPPEESAVQEITRLERLLARYRWRPAPLDLSERALAPPPAHASRPPQSLDTPRILLRVMAAAAVFVALLLGVRLLVPLDSGEEGDRGAGGGYAVTGLVGVDKIALGGWLETGAGQTAEIAVGDIGYVELEPGARVRLDDDGDEHHSLFLELGALTATIWSAPRVFQVGTPAGLTVDLGCRYRVEVDDEGRTRLRVEYGQVSFEIVDRKVYVPEGASCEAVPGRGPSAPIYDHVADPAFREAVAAVEFDEDPAAERIAIIAAARDPLTLWHLVRGAATATVREAAFTALLACEPPPAGVTRAGVLAGDQGMLAAWRGEMDWDWGDPYSKGGQGKLDGKLAPQKPAPQKKEKKKEK